MHPYAKQALKLVNRFIARHANLVFRPVLDSAPARTDPNAATLVYSVLDKKNVAPYLLAVKSFLRYHDRVHVVVQNDGTLDLGDLAILRRHVPDITLYSRHETIELLRPFVTRHFPFLTNFQKQLHFFILFKQLNILLRYQGQKVILLDSDIIFLKRPSLVIDWAEHGRDYCFYSDGGNGLTRQFRAMGFDYPEVDINDFNAGFFSFVHTIPLDFVVEVMTRVHAYDPALLLNWEIEQAIWAVLLNAHRHPLNLDHVGVDYVGGGTKPLAALQRQSVLAHFVGSVRYNGLRYPRLGHGIIRDLKQARRS